MVKSAIDNVFVSIYLKRCIHFWYKSLSILFETFFYWMLLRINTERKFSTVFFRQNWKFFSPGIQFSSQNFKLKFFSVPKIKCPWTASREFNWKTLQVSEYWENPHTKNWTDWKKMKTFVQQQKKLLNLSALKIYWKKTFLSSFFNPKRVLQEEFKMSSCRSSNVKRIEKEVL